MDSFLIKPKPRQIAIIRLMKLLGLLLAHASTLLNTKFSNNNPLISHALSRQDMILSKRSGINSNFHLNMNSLNSGNNENSASPNNLKSENVYGESKDEYIKVSNSFCAICKSSFID